MNTLQAHIKEFHDGVQQSLSDTGCSPMNEFELLSDKSSFAVGVRAALDLMRQGVPLRIIERQCAQIEQYVSDRFDSLQKARAN